MSIKVYSTATCPFCTMAKNYFKKNNITFENIDVGNDPQQAQEMINKSGQMGVPVIDIDGTLIIGFDQQAIEKALKPAPAEKK